MRRLLRVGWKLAILAAVVGSVVYRLHFAPAPVDGRPATMGPIVAEAMGTGTLEARVQATISPKISGLGIEKVKGVRCTPEQIARVMAEAREIIAQAGVVR